jgi:quercetin dioxygenase-like cupin family protein
MGGAEATRPTVTVLKAGPAAPLAAPGRSLWLARYEIPPRTRLHRHHHEGTQIGLVEAGVLTYHVLTGDVPVYRAGPDGRPMLDRTLRAGTVAEVVAGEWLVEGPEDHHWGANDGAVPLVIHTSSLLREGAPLATLDPE